MSNSPLVDYIHYSPNHSSGRVNSARKECKVDIITPHCYVGQCTIESFGNNFGRNSTQVSSNYGIDKNGRVGLFVDESNRSWCSSNRDNDARAITIECASDMSAPFAFTDACYQTLIKLCIDICKRHGKTKLLWFNDKAKTLAYKPAENEMLITVHRWFANKACPGDWLMGKLPELVDTVNKALNPEPEEANKMSLLDSIKKLFKSTGLFKELFTDYRKTLQDNDHSEWSKEDIEWAISTGLIKGSGTPLPSGEDNYMLEDFVSLERMIVILRRFAKNNNLK